MEDKKIIKRRREKKNKRNLEDHIKTNEGRGG